MNLFAKLTTIIKPRQGKTMPHENKRLLIAFEKLMREVNRETLNPMIPEFSVEDLKPILTLVSQARGNYLKELMDLASKDIHAEHLDTDTAKNLRYKRLIYEELVQAAKAFEVAIERGYLDVREK